MNVVTQNGATRMQTKVEMVAQAKSRLEDIRDITEVDLSSVLDVLGECTRVALAVDAMRIPMDTREKSTLQAELGRNLNRLADMLAAASSEAKMEYWRLKGFADPRD